MGPQAESEAEVLGGAHPPADALAKKLTVSLVTPRGQLAAHDCDEVVAPGELGEFGVLAGHIPFLSALRPGVLVIRNGTQREVYAVGSGFLEVGASGLVHVLVSRAQAAGEIDGAAAQTEKGKLTEQLAAGKPEAAQLDSVKDDLAYAQAKIDAKARAVAH